MINSINSGSTDWYSRKRNSMVDEIVAAATASVTQTTAVDTTSSEATDASATLATSKTNMSLEDSMKRMQGSKMPPPPPPDEETTDETTDSTETSETGLLGDIDADGDGTLSTDEYENMISQMGISNAMSAEDFFAKVDTDGDGEITKDEMDAAESTAGTAQQTKASQTLPSDIDADGDGTLSTDEYEDMISQMGISNAMSAEDFFAKVDTDGDGEITKDEMDAAESTTGTAQQTLPSDIDTDGDGSLSVDEYESLMEDLGLNNTLSSDEFFNQYDADEDGEVTSTELESYAAQALNAYQQNFQYMFDEEQSVLNSRA